LFDFLYEWFRRIDWAHFAGVAGALAFISLIRILNQHLGQPHPRRATVQPLSTRTTSSTVPQVGSVNTAQVRKLIFGRLQPLLRWLAFFAAVLMVLIGIQDMYSELNPRGRFQEPSISWPGAIFVAIDIAILWFGRQWWSQKSSG
jgi:hypothetical protein